jgi:hypothetical protein
MFMLIFWNSINLHPLPYLTLFLRKTLVLFLGLWFAVVWTADKFQTLSIIQQLLGKLKVDDPFGTGIFFRHLTIAVLFTFLSDNPRN